MPMIRRRTLSEDAHELRQLIMGDGHFVPVLVMTLLSLLFTVMEGSLRWMQALTALFFVGTLMLALWRSGVSRPVFRTCALFSAGVAAFAVVGLFVPGDWGDDSHLSTMVLRGLLALVILLTFAVVLRAAVRQTRVTLDTLAAALTSYLLIGVFFSLVYRIIDGATGGFFAQTPAPTPNDFMYFSFVSLTTTGYGDLTAASGVPRGAVIFELILGQVYLVTIISLVVSHLGRDRVPGALARGIRDADSGPDADSDPSESPEPT
ncbi:MAG: potassium channel family protein [Acidimicrobiia bacterium]|nr:potassium channel family protein [Acidimicrobiia bacterium]